MIKSIKSAISEIHNVSWPTKKHAINISRITIIFTLLSALFIGVMDYGFAEVYTFLSSFGSENIPSLQDILPVIDTESIQIEATGENGEAVDPETIKVESTEK